MANSAEEVWQILGELAAAQKETDHQLKKLAAAQRETSHQLKESARRVDQQISRVDKQISDLGGAWGRFAEDLVAPACQRLFLERGIPVNRVSQRVKNHHDGETLEIDVLVVNQGHILAVEVKSSLDVVDVKAFIEDLQQFRRFFPEYAQMQLYGAVAGIGIESGADRYAYRQGLFVLTQVGESVAILNDAKFEPKAW